MYQPVLELEAIDMSELVGLMTPDRGIPKYGFQSHLQRFLKAGDRDRTGNIQLGRLDETPLPTQ